MNSTLKLTEATSNSGKPIDTFGRALDEIRSIAASPAELGTLFEQLVIKLLESEPSFGIKRAYTWADWPERQLKTGLSGKGSGIDLVSETLTGEHVAIQCKCYDDEIVPKRELNSFFALGPIIGYSPENRGEQVFDSCWVISTSPLSRDSMTFIKNQGERFRVIDFNYFRDVPFLVNRQVKEPYPFQVEAIERVLEGFKISRHDRGRLIMACGTGKTLVSLRIAERLKSGTGAYLFLAPSIALVNQARREWLLNTTVGFKPLVVCSDRSAGGRGEEDISLAELTCPVTTDANRVASFLKKNSNDMCVVFCTYHSLQRVCEALEDTPDLEFDLTIADEAHRTTGVLRRNAQVNFQLVHDATLLKSKKRLYMTATPRVYSDSSKKSLEKKGLTVVDMSSNQDVYGIEFYRIGFGEAVALGQLTEYRVIVLGVSLGALPIKLRSKMAEVEFEPSYRGRSVLKPSDTEMVRVLGTALAVNGVYESPTTELDEKKPLRKVIAYANNIGRSKWYANILGLPELKALTTRRMDRGKFASRLVSNHIDGSANAFQRTNLLTRLEKADRIGETHLVSNVKLFTEGVDVPSLDAVVFLDPRDSEVDVIQAVGRVMRRASGKKYGYIVVPVVLTEEANWLDELEWGKDGYSTIGKVLRALQSHDSEFLENIGERVHIVECPASDRPPSDSGINSASSDAMYEDIWERLRAVDQNIFAKVVATSKLAKPGKLVTERITHAIVSSEKVFLHNKLDRLLADTLGMENSRSSDPQNVCRISALLICNALLMHRRLKSTVPQMQMLVGLDKINVSEQPIGNLCDQWETILEIDYYPIFGPAISLLRALRKHGYTDKQTHAAIHPLIECTNEVADSLSELGYDHAGPLYHKILESRDSDGAYYTNPLSGILLARLLLNEDVIDWTDVRSVLRLRILDPACGTGTLLLAVAKTIKDRLLESNTDFEDREMHAAIVENILCGLDINHHAVQLSGANLTLGAPTVDYKKMNLAVMKHGQDVQHNTVYCGSLELLDPDRSSVIQGLTHAFESLSDLGAEGIGGAGAIDFPLRDLDMIIMNPPFTNNVKRSTKYSREARKEISFREKKIVERLSEEDELASLAIDYNAIATFFGPLADLLLDKKRGGCGLVSSTTSWLGASVRYQRRLLTKRFDVECVITNHNPSKPNFSENTDINESLVVLRRKSKSIKKQTKFVSMLHFPKSIDEAIEYSRNIEDSEVSNWGSISVVDSASINEEPWIRCAVFNARLAEIVEEFRSNYIETATNDDQEFEIAGRIASIEPAGRRVNDAFRLINENETVDQSESRFPLLWYHKTGSAQTIQCVPDGFGEPKFDKRSYATLLWKKRSKLLIANRIRTTNVRVVSRVVDVPVLGSAWVPITPHKDFVGYEHIWSLWLNSSYLIPHLLISRSKTLTYPKFSLDQLRALPLLNPTFVDADYLKRIWNSVSENPLLPWSQADKCPVRATIDEAVASVSSIELEQAKEIRSLVTREPTINPKLLSYSEVNS